MRTVTVSMLNYIKFIDVYYVILLKLQYKIQFSVVRIKISHDKLNTSLLSLDNNIGCLYFICFIVKYMFYCLDNVFHYSLAIC